MKTRKIKTLKGFNRVTIDQPAKPKLYKPNHHIHIKKENQRILVTDMKTWGGLK